MAKIKAPEKIAQPQKPLEERSGISEFFTRHKDLFSYISVAVLLVAGIIVLIQINNRTKEKQASILLGNAITQLNSSLSAPNAATGENDTDTPRDTTESIGAFQEIIDNYPGTKSEVNALLLMGSAYLADGRNDEAIDKFQAFLQKKPDHLLAAEAELGIATALFNKNEIKASLDKLEHIRSAYPAFPMKDVLEYEIAKRYEAMEDWDNARRIYNDVVDNFPDSPWKTMAQRKLRQLNIDHPEQAEDKKEMKTKDEMKK